jgi:hypothetical protein
MESTDPNKPGTATTEFKLTVVVSVVGAIVAGLSLSLTQLQTIYPDARWIVVAVGLVGGLGTVVATVSKFIGSRTDIKVGQLGVEAAQVNADARTAASSGTKPVAVSPSKPLAPPPHP